MRHAATLLILLVATAAMAGNITRQQARKAAQDFAAQRSVKLLSEPRRAPGTTDADADAQPLYIFNTAANQGFVIVAGDDRVEPIIGYTTSGTYDTDAMPDNFRAWLQIAQQELSVLTATTTAVRKAPSQQQNHEAIPPLIPTHWNQGNATAEGYIYNTLTPTIDDSHTLTGCVATAGAQVMYYYRHPKSATQPVPGYKPNDKIGNLAPLPAITFNWDAMKTDYTSADHGTEAENAVSQLMLYCGYAAHMNYDLDGSGASEYTLTKNMAEYFDYDPYTLKSVSRDSYSVSEWDNLIYGELAAGRPVIYSGQAWFGDGHAFLLDGYDGQGFYHFNWGWGGAYDGFFRLHVTNPYKSGQRYSDGSFKSGFVIDCAAIIGLQPNTGNVPVETEDENANDTWEDPEYDSDDTWDVPTTDYIVANVSNNSVSGTTVSLRYSNPYDEAQAFACGLAELNGDGTLTLLSSRSYLNTSLDKGWGFTLSFNVADFMLPEGTHTLIPVSQRAADMTWRQCTPLDKGFRVTVSDGNIDILAKPVVSLPLSDIECIGTQGAGDWQKIAFDITNTGDNYDGHIYLFVGTDDTKTYTNFIELKILAEGTQHRYIWWPSPNAGTYNVWLTTDYGATNIIGQTRVEIFQQPVQVSDVKLVTSPQPGTRQTVSYKVDNRGGNYTGSLYLFASTSSTKGSYADSNYLRIKAGGTKQRTMSFTPEAIGTYNIWITSDAAGNNVLAQTTVDIQQSLTATQIAFTGNKMATTNQEVIATVLSAAGEYTQPLYLFASTSQSNKGNAIYCAPTAIEEGQTEDVRFLFYPATAGTYYIWLTTDEEGTNVIASANVQISAPPTGTVTLAIQDNGITTTATTATLTLTVRNTSSVTYYQGFEANVFKKKVDGGYDYVDSYTTDDITLAPGQTTTLTAPFKNLETGATYMVNWYYRPTYGGSWSWIDGTYYTFQPTAAPGDVNGDGKVDTQDAIKVIQYYLGKNPSDFNADAADVTNDNTIDTQDAIQIIRIFLNK